MNNPPRQGGSNKLPLSVPPGPPTRAPSSSTSHSAHSNAYTAHTPSQYEPDGAIPQSLSPSSLNPPAHGSGHSIEYHAFAQAHHHQQQHFRAASQHQPPPPPPPSYSHQQQNIVLITGQPVVGDPQTIDLGQLPGYGFPPGGPLVLGWPNPAPVQTGGGFGKYYEPQGELQTQLQSQSLPQQDFVSPVPVPARRESAASGQDAFGGGGGAPVPGMIATAHASSYTDMSARTQASQTMNTKKRKAGSRSNDRGESGAASTSGPSPPLPEQKRKSVSKTSTSGGTAEAISPRTMRRRPTQGAQDSEADDDDEDEDDEEDEPQAQQGPGQAQGQQAQGQGQGASGSVAGSRASAPKLKQSDSGEVRRIAEVAHHLTTVLPAGKVFPIQIGSELFRLSGASISSDAPSYFSHYFGEQLIQTGGRASQVKTLYIDRDPNTFKDIALHLQGYYVKPRDEEHFVRLFADAQFYSLPRLTQQLFRSEIFIQVGDRHFQIPRDLFSSPGDSPNFFSLGFAHFFTTPSEVFPGLDRQTLLRPPSILPPSVANRSGDVFADLLRILQGYDVKIRDEDHRAELLRDARYFHLKGVEQRLIPCKVSHNVLRGRSEMVLRLEDIRQSGVSFLPEAQSRASQSNASSVDKSGRSGSDAEEGGAIPSGWITYQRPYVDETAFDLILEISSTEATRLDMASMRASFSGQVKARVASLFSVIATKLNLPAMVPLGLMMMQSGGGIAAQPVSPANSGVSGDRVRIRIDRDAFVSLDGDTVEWDDQDDDSEESSDENMTDESAAAALPKVRKWKRERALNKEMEWLVQRGQWRLRVEPAEDLDGSPSKVEVVLCAIRLEGYTREMHRNRNRDFLS